MRKRMLSAAMAGMMVVSMTACGGSKQAETTAAATEAETTAAESAAEESSAEETKAAADIETVTPGKLTVATSPDFAPYEFYAIGEDGTPKLAGFDMDLAQYIADKMGLELEVVPMDFDGVLSELSQKNVDLGMAGLSPDPARADAMEFSDLYYKGGQSFVTVKDKAVPGS